MRGSVHVNMLAGVALLSLATAAVAQEVPPAGAGTPTAPPVSDPSGTAKNATVNTDGAGDATGSAAAGDIVVTAQFRSQRLQDTPLSITASNAALMEARNQTNVIDVANRAPNVTLQQAGSGFGASTSVSIRGVGQYDYNFAVEPGVGMYVDDVYYSTLYGSIFDLLDLDRVEVLRGPQGTLAGKNSIGGAIKLYSKVPTGSGKGYAEATYGSFDRIDVRAGFDFALVPDKVLVRIAGVSKHRDGYLTRYDYSCRNPGSALPTYTTSSDCKLGREGGQDVNALRGSVLFKISPDIENTVIADVVKDKSEAIASKLIYADNPGVTLNGVPFDSRFLTGRHSYSSYATYTGHPGEPNSFSIPPVATLSGWGVSNTLDWHLGDKFSLKSISAYRYYNGQFSLDSDGSPLDLQNSANKVFHRQYSQELRGNAKLLDDKLNLTAGLFYFESRSRLRDRNDLGAAGLDFLDNDPVHAKSKSAFADGTFNITDRLQVVGGVRYTKESKTYGYTRLNPDGTVPQPFLDPTQPPPQNFQLAGLNGLSGRYSGSRWDYRAGVNYKINDDMLVYAQTATGFKGGGVNPRPFVSTHVRPFGPERLTAYELGFKSDLFDRLLRLNLSAFSNKYRDIQLTLLRCDNISPFPGFPCALPANAGNATVKGLEAEATLNLAEGLEIDGSAGYLDFKYNDTDPNSGIVKGMKPPFSPKWKYAVGVQYVAIIGNDTVTPRLDYTYLSATYSQAINAPENRSAGYGLLNGRLSWKMPDKGLELALSGTNLLNKFYYISKYDLHTAPYFLISGLPGRPREWAATVKKTF